MSSVARLQLCSRLTDGQLMALFLRMVCVRVYSCTYALTHTSALCWERAMGTEIPLHRMVWLFKGRQHNKRGRLGRESEIVSEWIPVICLPASGAFSVLLPWQQWLAVCVCAASLWDKGCNSACHQCSLELTPQLLVAMRPDRHILLFSDESFLWMFKSH